MNRAKFPKRWLVYFVIIGIALSAIISGYFLWKSSLQHSRQKGPAPHNGADAYRRTVRALNEGWDAIEIGNSYFGSGEFSEAAQAYRRAYDVDPGNRLFSGNKLIETYEKMQRYDDAILVVDEIMQRERLAKFGVEQFSAIRARLIAAKTESNQSSTNQVSA